MQRARRAAVVDDAQRAVIVSRLLVAELAEQRQDLILALERELDVLAILAVMDLDDLVCALRHGLAVEDHLESLLAQCLLLRAQRARKVVGELERVVVRNCAGTAGRNGTNRSRRHGRKDQGEQKLLQEWVPSSNVETGRVAFEREANGTWA